MVSCGTNDTGSNEDSGLSILDLLLQQDNFGDFDSDGISDDFGVLYDVPDTDKPPAEYYPDGTCVKELDEDFYNEQVKTNPHPDGSKPDETDPPPPPPAVDIPGCTDPLATNYDSTATVDNGSCIHPAVPPPTPPTADPDMSAYAEFLIPRSMEDANKEAKNGYFVPTSAKDYKDGYRKVKDYKDANDDWVYKKVQYGFSSINGKKLPENVGYYDVPGDGSEGYFKWIQCFNYRDTKYMIPAPRPFHLAIKYWRNGGYDDKARNDQHSVGCNANVVKDGMYTAGLCPQVKEIVFHTTGIPNESKQMDPLRHAAGGPTKKGWSTFPYHWMFRKDGWAAQMLPDWKYGAGVGPPVSRSDVKNIGITWMSYKEGSAAESGGYPEVGSFKWKVKRGKRIRYFSGRAMTVDEFKAKGDWENATERTCWPTDAQIINMGKLCAIYIKRYPDIVITAHHAYKAKHCPNFWVASWVAAGGVPGLNQAGIDKFIKKGGKSNGTEEDGFVNHKDLNTYGKNELLIYAAQRLAKISNPAGIGGGNVPHPTSNSNSPVSTDVDSFGNPVKGSPNFKAFNDMDCSEFKTFYHNIRNNGPLSGPKNLLAFQRSLPSGAGPDTSGQFSNKCFTCEDQL